MRVRSFSTSSEHSRSNDAWIATVRRFLRNRMVGKLPRSCLFPTCMFMARFLNKLIRTETLAPYVAAGVPDTKEARPAEIRRSGLSRPFHSGIEKLTSARRLRALRREQGREHPEPDFALAHDDVICTEMAQMLDFRIRMR